MSVDHKAGIQRILRTKYGIEPAENTWEDLAPLWNIIEHPSVKEYLLHCVPSRACCFPDIRVLPLRGILEEAFELCYERIRPFGFIVLATGYGGNAVCCHGGTGKVYAADHTSFSDGLITFPRDWHNVTGEWVEVFEYSQSNVERALSPLSDDVLGFVEELLEGRWRDRLDELDI